MLLHRAVVTFLLVSVACFRQRASRGVEEESDPAVKGGAGNYDPSPFGFSCDNQTTYTLASYCPQMAKAGIRWIRGFPDVQRHRAGPGEV